MPAPSASSNAAAPETVGHSASGALNPPEEEKIAADASTNAVAGPPEENAAAQRPQRPQRPRRSGRTVAEAGAAVGAGAGAGGGRGSVDGIRAAGARTAGAAKAKPKAQQRRADAAVRRPGVQQADAPNAGRTAHVGDGVARSEPLEVNRRRRQSMESGDERRRQSMESHDGSDSGDSCSTRSWVSDSDTTLTLAQQQRRAELIRDRGRISMLEERERERERGRERPATAQSRRSTISSLMSSFSALQPQDTSDSVCPVCYEDQRELRGGFDGLMIGFFSCQNRAHQVCLHCALTYVSNYVQTQRVDGVPCIMGSVSGGCGGELGLVHLTVRDFERILDYDPPVLEKYRRVCRLQRDPDLRECPCCQALCEPKRNDEGAIVAEMVCEECQQSFCFYHSLAHKDGSCAEYEQKQRRESVEISQMLNTKRCPSCQRQTEKNGGCNHMSCRGCGGEWCWICERKLTINDVDWHYSEANVESGCIQFSRNQAVNVEEVRTRRLQERDLRKLRTWPECCFCAKVCAMIFGMIVFKIWICVLFVLLAIAHVLMNVIWIPIALCLAVKRKCHPAYVNFLICDLNDAFQAGFRQRGSNIRRSGGSNTPYWQDEYDDDDEWSDTDDEYGYDDYAEHYPNWVRMRQLEAQLRLEDSDEDSAPELEEIVVVQPRAQDITVRSRETE